MLPPLPNVAYTTTDKLTTKLPIPQCKFYRVFFVYERAGWLVWRLIKSDVYQFWWWTSLMENKFYSLTLCNSRVLFVFALCSRSICTLHTWWIIHRFYQVLFVNHFTSDCQWWALVFNNIQLTLNNNNLSRSQMDLTDEFLSKNDGNNHTATEWLNYVSIH